MTNARADQVDRVVAAVEHVDGVAGLHRGGPGSPATYLPGRTVSGIRIGDGSGQVSIVVDLGPDTDLIKVADTAQKAATEAAGVPMSVVVADIAVVGLDDAAHTSKELSA